MAPTVSRVLLLLTFTAFIALTHAIHLDSSLFKSDILLSHARVGIRNFHLARKSLYFPYSIPLLFGNSILNFKRSGSHYILFHDSVQHTQIYPLKRKVRMRHIAGFMFKESTLRAYPVPMENSMVLLRLIRKRRRRAPIIHVWVISHGVYSHVQKRRQRLYIDALAQDIADNLQRALGVAHCRNKFTTAGLCNNKRNPLFGASLQPMLLPITSRRPSSNSMLEMKPNPRDISNTIFTASRKHRAPHQTNLLMVIFGQFLDHEIVATPGEKTDPDAITPIETDNGSQMSFTRSASLKYDYGKCCKASYRNGKFWLGTAFNAVTPFIDGGVIYGSNNLRAMSLRTFRGGRLISKRHHKEEYLPFNHPRHLLFKQENEPTADLKNLFVGGDVRANENAFLLALHTVFVRHHNRMTNLLRQHVRRKKAWKFTSDEWLFQTAKKLVVAQLQCIIFNEFVPAMLGPNALGKYQGYKPNVDPRISLFHSTIAFRWGHSAIPEVFRVKSRRHRMVTRRLRDLFFHPKRFLEHGVDNVLEAAIRTNAADVDEQMVDSLRNTLFNPSKGEVLDLAALNLQRQRDLNMPGYLEMQRIFKTGKGLENIPENIQKKLIRTYGKASEIDAFSGGLSERKKDQSLLGPLFHAINVDQFRRLRDGDSMYYKRLRWEPVIRDMGLIGKIMNDKVRMSHIIFANTRLRGRRFRNKNLFKTA